MLVRTVVGGLLVLLFAQAAQAATTPWDREATHARAALTRSVNAGYIAPADEARYLVILRHARAVHDRVPPLRARVLANVLSQVVVPKSPTAPRALQLYTTLAENAEYLDTHRLPPDGTDITGADGAVYRYFAGQGLEFHPLDDAGKLNSFVAAGDTEGARTLAAALAARAVPQPGGSVVWEYRFNFGNEHDPWTSGLAQAVLAQALARAGDLELARRAYRAIPGSLDRPVAAGRWIRLYSGSSLAVLNAQLQSGISIGDYAELAHDDAAAAYANDLLATAKAMLRRFDTGHWSRYSLGVESDLHYQDFVITLLTMLAKRTGDPAWSNAATRFQLYETQPPLMTSPTVTRVVYPLPEDAVRDSLVVRFYLSKISKVALIVDGKAVDGYRWGGGWHVFRWTPLALAPGAHVAHLAASDLAGNSGSTDLGSFTVARDTTPPLLAAAKGNGRVFWHAKDGESACCGIELELTHGSEHRLIASRRTKGAASIPEGYWLVTVVARDAAGNRAERPLGLVVGHAPKTGR